MTSLWIWRLTDLLYPPECLAEDCGRRGAWLCAEHEAAIVPLPAAICARCADVLPTSQRGDAARGAALCAACRHRPPAFEGVHAVGVYRGVMRDAILAIKYRRRQAAGAALGEMVARRCAGVGADLVISIPAHRRRVLQRGVDHAQVLGRGVAAALGAPIDAAALARVRDTRPQVGLGAAERHVNISDAFAANADRVAGRRVLLVDDVVTTGSTVGAAAAALRAAGADSVVVGCLARAAMGEHDR